MKRCHLVVCADVEGRRKRPQRVGDRTWNGQVYLQRPRDRDPTGFEFIDQIETANRKNSDQGT